MKISRLKPLLRTPVAGKTRLRRNLLIFMLCCAVKPCWFISVPGRYSGTLTPLEIQPFFPPPALTRSTFTELDNCRCEQGAEIGKGNGGRSFEGKIDQGLFAMAPVELSERTADINARVGCPQSLLCLGKGRCMVDCLSLEQLFQIGARLFRIQFFFSCLPPIKGAG